MRNNVFLEKLLSLYPDSKWDIFKVIYSEYNIFKNISNEIYDFYLDKNICIPLSILNHQINKDDYHFLMNNSLFYSINSVDWNFLKLIKHSNLNVKLFLDLIQYNRKFVNFILDTDINLNLDIIYKEISRKNFLDLDLIRKYDIWDWELLSDNLNLNDNFLKEHHNKNWDSKRLSKNPHFNISWVRIFPDFSWDWDSISQNKNLKIEWILDYPDQKWNFQNIILSQHFELSWLKIICDFQNNHPNSKMVNWEKCHNFKINWVHKFPKYKWSFFKISHHPNFVFDWINSYPNEKWDWRFLSLNSRINLDILRKYYPKWSVYNLILNNSFTIEWIKEFPNWSWSFSYISNLKDVRLSWLQSFPKSSWDYKEILLKSTLNIKLIKWIRLRFSSRCWFYISRNKSFNINWVTSNNYNLIDWYHGVSGQESLKIEWVLKYPKAQWNINKIIENKNIVVQDYQILIKLFNLNITDFSTNPNLTLEFIRVHQNQLDFKKLSYNNFNGIYHQNNQKILLKREQLKIFGQELIQKTWHPKRFWDWCLDNDDKI